MLVEKYTYALTVTRKSARGLILFVGKAHRENCSRQRCLQKRLSRSVSTYTIVVPVVLFVEFS